MNFLHSLRKYLCCWPTRIKCGQARDKTARLLEKACCCTPMRGSSYSFNEDGHDTIGPQRDEDTQLMDRIAATCNEKSAKKRLASVGKGLLGEMGSRLAIDKRDATAVQVVGDLKGLCDLCHERDRRAQKQPRKKNVSIDDALSIGSVFSVLDGECRACLVASKTQKLRNDLYRLGFELRLVLDTMNTMEERLVCLEQELLERPRSLTSSLDSSTYPIHTPRSMQVSSDEDYEDDEDSQYTYTCSTLDSRSSLASTSTTGSMSIVFIG